MRTVRTAAALVAVLACALLLDFVVPAGVQWTTMSEWFWTARTVISGAKAAYRTQSGAGFSAWTTRGTAPDQVFRLVGSAGPPPDAPTPVAPVVPAPAPSAPTAPATPTPAPPSVAAPAFAKLVTLPSAKRCVSRRKLRIGLHAPKGATIAKATIKVAGRATKVVKGKALTAPIDLTGLPRGSYAVKVTITLDDGRTVSGTRTYRTCAAKDQHRSQR